MPDNTFQAIITVLDKATLPLRAIGKQIDALGAPVRHIGEGLAEVAEHAGLEKLRERAEGVKEKFGELFEHVTSLIGPLEILGAGATAAGLIEMTRHAGEFGAALFDTSIKTGVATDALAKLHFAAQQSGTSTELLDKGLERLNRTIADAAAGKNQEAAALFRKLGISLRDSQGHLRDAGQLLPLVAEGMARNENPALRARMAFALFGRAGNELLPLLAEGRKHMEELGEEADHLGLTMSGEAAKGAKEFEDAWKRLEGAAQGLSNAIGAQLFPVLEPLIESMTEWLAENRALIATGVREFVSGLAETIRQIDWEGVVESTKSFLETAWQVIEAIGGVKTVILGMVLIAAGPLLSAIVSVGGALAGLGAALLATPVGWFLGAIAGIALAVYEVYEHWTPIKKFFADLWEGVVGIFAGAWHKIESIVDAVKNAAHRLVSFGADATRSGDIDPSTGLPMPALPDVPAAGAAERRSLPALYGGSGVPGAAGAPGASGEVRVKVDISGAQPGTRVDAQSTGVAAPEVDVGYNFAPQF